MSGKKDLVKMEFILEDHYTLQSHDNTLLYGTVSLVVKSMIQESKVEIRLTSLFILSHDPLQVCMFSVPTHQGGGVEKS